MNAKILATFDRHAAATFDKQLYLADLVGVSHRWDFDMASGMLSFDGKHRWKVQMLGSQSDRSGTWLWAWANEASDIPPGLLTSVNALRKLGTERSYDELCQPNLPADKHDGHFWAVLATGLCKAKAYYRGVYEGGAVFLMITDRTFPWHIDDPLARLASVFPQAISSLAIANHREALLGHAQLLGLTVTQQQRTALVADASGNHWTAQFDQRNRLARLSGSVGAVEQLPGQDAPTISALADGVTRKQVAPTTAKHVSTGRKISRYVKLWLHHCWENFLGATLLSAVIAAVVGLIVWWIASPEVATIVAAVVFVGHWVVCFHPTDLETDVRYLRRKGWVTVWVSSLRSTEALQKYVEAYPEGFGRDVGIGEPNSAAVVYAPLGKDLAVTIRGHVRGAVTDEELADRARSMQHSGYGTVLLYHDLDYRRLIVPEAVAADAPVAWLGTFRYSTARPQ